ncbi:MAG: disulfide bond formation protein B [Candidatus Dasytiphilus stammeri]
MNNSNKDFNYYKSHAYQLCHFINMLVLFGNNIILIMAFYYQLVWNELPCPICLLQRIGIIIISIGFFLNIRFGIRSIHYGIALLGCILTGIIAMRQVFLHILPGDLGYGSTLFNFHFYTLALLSSILTIVVIAILLILKDSKKTLILLTKWDKINIIIFSLLIAANVVSTFIECGIGDCESNPTSYQLLKSYNNKISNND